MDNSEKTAVLELQRYLRTISYSDSRIPPLPIDGIFTDATVQAVEVFQSLHGLPSTGRVDEQTWNEIYLEYLRYTALSQPPERIAAFAADEKMAIGSSGYSVHFLQLMLRRLGESYINIGNVEATGVYDERTEAAVQIIRLAAIKPGVGVDKAAWNEIVRLYNETVN